MGFTVFHWPSLKRTDVRSSGVFLFSFLPGTRKGAILKRRRSPKVPEESKVKKKPGPKPGWKNKFKPKGYTHTHSLPITALFSDTLLHNHKGSERTVKKKAVLLLKRYFCITYRSQIKKNHSNCFKKGKVINLNSGLHRSKKCVYWYDCNSYSISS